MSDAVNGHAVRELGDDGIRFRVAHAVRGRTRLRVDSPDQLDALAEAVQRFLAAEPGIDEIRVVPASQSIVLTYDPDVLSPERLLALATEPAIEADWLGSVAPGLSRARAALDGALQQAIAAGEALVRQVNAAWPAGWEAWMPRVLKRAA